jgi:hypothetical protein
MAHHDIKVPPTVLLPPIKRIGQCSPAELSAHLAILRQIYTPNVYGTHQTTQGDENLQSIQMDKFELSYAMRWLTAIVAMSEAQEGEFSPLQEDVLREAAALLAICSGSASAGSFGDQVSRQYDCFILICPSQGDISSSHSPCLEPPAL